MTLIRLDEMYNAQFQITVFSQFYYVLYYCYVIMNISIARTMIDKLKIT